MRAHGSLLVVVMGLALPLAACGGRTHAGSAVDGGRDGAAGGDAAAGVSGAAGAAAPDDAAADTEGTAGTGAAGTGAAGTGVAGTGVGVAGTGVDAAIDATVDMAPVDAQPDGKANGLVCAVDGDCRLGHCVEGVCCESACTSKCTSCRLTNTGKAEGTCAAVTAGVAHANDCAASAATTCGLDGKCDGAGACRSWAGGTSCAVEACTDAAAVSNYSAARTCDGHGVCTAGATSTCGGAYRCTGTKCKTTCTGAPDCVPADYCTGGACVAKKPDGQPCASGAECAKGVCGGLCCVAGCTCAQQSPSNVIKNAGFDQDTSNWTADGGTFSRTLSDYEQCPYSGAGSVTLDATGSSQVSQCVSNTPFNGTFNFGAAIEVTGTATVIGQASFFTGFNCDGDEVADNETNGLAATSGWQVPAPESSPDGLSVAHANSVKFSFYMNGNAGTVVYVDQVFVAPVPTKF
jgi:hypothetical protein